MERIAIIAGGGELPVIFARELRKKGIKVIGFAIKDVALPSFDAACDRAHRMSVTEIKKFIFLLITERVRKIALLGKVEKSVIFGQIKKEQEAKDVLDKVKDKMDYSLLDAVTKKFKTFGVDVIDPVKYIPELMPQKGVLTKRAPTPEETEDINFGVAMAKKIAGLDIGQTIIVKEKAIVSVEAMEGTDSTISRASETAGEGFVVVKAARPDQDMRWDIPVVGPETIKRMIENKASALAMKANKMLLVDRDACVSLADAAGISIVVV